MGDECRMLRSVHHSARCHSFPPQLEAESVLFKKNIVHLFPVKYNFGSMPLWGTCHNVRDPKKLLKSETPPSLTCASPWKCC